jgi:alkanesulfonate monooxygenase SsuD/methylene tetrahydromethanopterin reductase-like flavin-dependent oxidoreductase (luciferase family)
VLVDIGIGLPSTIPGVQRDQLLTWARRADERGFSSLGTIDRLVYGNLESLVALSAAAAVTERIRLATDILLAPLRGNGALLAKQAATIDALSGGRLTLGVGVGARAEDFEAAGVPFERRGRLMDELLEEMKQVWAGQKRGFAGAIGPPPAREGGPELLIGGGVDAAVRRVARFGDGWTMGGGPPEAFEEVAGRVKQAWSDAGREGAPRLMALCYFALGDGAREAADWYIHDYYAFIREAADQVAKGAAVGEGMAQQYRDAFAAAGADELIYFPCSPDPAQVDLLADAVF